MYLHLEDQINEPIIAGIMIMMMMMMLMDSVV